MPLDIENIMTNIEQLENNHPVENMSMDSVKQYIIESFKNLGKHAIYYLTKKNKSVEYNSQSEPSVLSTEYQFKGGIISVHHHLDNHSDQINTDCADASQRNVYIFAGVTIENFLCIPDIREDEPIIIFEPDIGKQILFLSQVEFRSFFGPKHVFIYHNKEHFFQTVDGFISQGYRVNLNISALFKRNNFIEQVENSFNKAAVC